MVRLIRAPDDIQSPTHVKNINEIDQFLMTMTGEYIVDEAEDRYVRLNNL